MNRGAKFGLLAGGLILLAAVALTLALRAPLLEILLRSALATRGLPNADLTVENVTLSETTITGLALGAADELQVAKMVIAYEPRGLVVGRVKGVALDGTRLKLDLRGDGPPLGSLQEMTAGGGPEPMAVPAPPPVILRDARIEAETALGLVSGRIEGEVRPGEDGALKAVLQFDLEGEPGRLRGDVTAVRAPAGRMEASLSLADGALALPGAELSGLRGKGAFSATGTVPETAKFDLAFGEVAVPGASFEQARLAMRLAGTRLEIDAELATQDGQFAARANADLIDFPVRPSGQVQLEADIGARAVLWPLLAVPAPSKGRAEIRLSARGRLPPLPGLIGNRAGLLSQLRPEDFTGRAKLRFQEIDYPGLVQGLSGEVGLEASPDPESAQRFTGALEFALTAKRITAADAEVRDIALTQALLFKFGNEKTTVTSQNTGRISAGEVRYSSILRSRERLTARVETAAATIRFDPQGGLSAAHDLTLIPGAIEFALPRRDAAPLALSARAKQVRARGDYSAAKDYTGRIAIEDGGITVPQLEAAAEHLDATLELADGGRRELAFQLGALRHTAEPSRVAPLNLRGKIRQAGNTVTFSALGAGPGGVGEVSLRGRHDLASGAGQAKAALAPLRFAPDGAQPGALLPALADLRNVAGEAQAEATLTWTEKSRNGTAALKIADVSLDSAAARIEGLFLDLALNQVRPPGSAPGQVFRVRRMDLGVPLDDLSVRFRILPGDSPAVAVESAGVRLAGGRFSLAKVVVDPADRQQRLPVRVEGLDLADVFALLGVEGLSGDGRLSGAIPINVTDGVPVIADGEMKAEGPGVLRIRSDTAKRALESAGESAALMLRALEDFRYEELSLTIDQPSEDLAVLGLSMLGSNPDVLDGYPFRFNVNLETDPRKLLGTLREAVRISDRAIRKMWIFGR